MLDMIIERLGEDHDIVEINKTERILVSSEDFIHNALECCWSVAKTLCHELEFIKTTVIGKCGVFTMILVDGYLEIPRLEIHSRDKFRSTQSIECFAYSG
jgi:hypothetical protein